MKNIQKTMSVLLVVMLLLSLWPPIRAVEGESVQLSMTVSQNKVEPGDSLSLSIQTNQTFSTRGSGLTVCYDDAILELDLDGSAAASPFTIHGPFQINGRSAFRISFMPGATEETISASEPIAMVQFKALTTVQQTAISMEAAYLYDSDLTEIPLQKAKDIFVTVASAPPTLATDYIVAMPEDMTAVIGKTVQIPVTIAHGDGEMPYHAFDICFAYDPGILKLASAQIPGVTVTEQAEQIHVVGYGEDRASGAVAFTLEFQVLQQGVTEVQITTAKVDHAANAVVQNASSATLMDDKTSITASGYPVTLPEGFIGEPIAVPDEDYTFAAPTDHYDYSVMVTIGGTQIAVTDNGDGTYTIPAEQITGEIVVTASRTGKVYQVTLGTDMEGEDRAQYMVDYAATLHQDEHYSYNVLVTIGGIEYTGYGVYDDTYQIPGGDIVGDIVFTVTKTLINNPSDPTEPTQKPTEPSKDPTEPTQKPTEPSKNPTDPTKPSTAPTTKPATKPATMHKVTFAGSGAGAAQGNATSVAHGKNYTLTLKKEAGYTYQVSYVMGGNPSVTATANKDGTYTIKKVTAPLKITIEKTLASPISVYEFVNLDDRTVFLVLANTQLDQGKVFAYESRNMYWSDRYGAYAWLVTVEDADLDIQQMAEANITIISENAAGKVPASGDVDQSKQTDLADVQLIQSMYNAQCTLESHGILKFLSADINGDHKLDTQDAVAAIQIIGR